MKRDPHWSDCFLLDFDDGDHDIEGLRKVAEQILHLGASEGVAVGLGAMGRALLDGTGTTEEPRGIFAGE